MDKKLTKILLLALFAIWNTVAFGQLTVVVNSTNVTCNGAGDGTATALPYGGSGNYAFAWSNGQSGYTIANLGAGSYTVTVTDLTSGATATGGTYVSEPAPITLAMSASYETCDVSNDGTAGVIGYGGTGNMTPLWSDGQTGWVAYNLSAGTYSVTVTDANGCSAVGSVTVEPSPEGIWLGTHATDATCAGECDGTAYTMPMTGAPPYTFQWSGTTQTTDSITGLCPGTYSVTVTDANGCSSVDQATVNEPPILAVNATSTPSGCAGTNTGTATASAGGGTPGYTFQWSNGASGMTIMDLAPGTYSVTVTDAHGCTATTSVEVGQSGASNLSYTLSANNTSCYGSCDGQAEVTVTSGTAPYTYEWSTGATGSSVSGLCAGDYSVTVSDASGCPIAQMFSIDQPSQISLSFTSTGTNCGAADGTATVTASGGNGGYSYLWSNGQTTATATGLSAGVHSVTVTDSKGCTMTGQVTVEQAGGSLTANVSSASTSCSDSNDGSAAVTVTSGTAPYVYEWSNGATGAINNGIPAGDYSVTVTDASGCSVVKSVTVASPPPIEITFTITPASCGLSNGSASALVSGGVGGYTYLWDYNNTTDSTISNVPAGNYLLTVADANLCLANATAVVTQSGGQVQATVTTTDVACNGGNDGSATITVTAGSAPYTYNWSTGDTGETATGLAAGDYGWTVTDATGCMANGMVTIGEPDAMVLTTSSQPASCGVDNGMASVSVTGGTAPYTYKWNDTFGQTGYSAMNLPPGTYTVLVTDANGCTASATVTVESVNGFTCQAMVASSYNGAHISSIGGSDGAATVQMTGGNAGYFSFAWSNGQTTQTITGLSAGTYTVVVKDDLTGCTCESSVTLEDPAKLGNYVWLDANSNGVQDAGETGVEGVNVTVTGTSGYGLMIDLSTTTDANGMYMFTLPKGDYKVTFELPANHDFTTANAGGDDALDSDADPTTGMTQIVNLSPGEYNPDLDAGLIKNCVSVGDFVWLDIDQNGFQDNGSAGVADIQVALLSAGPDGSFGTADDVTEMTTVTDADGHYLFDCVIPGTYAIQFSNIPSGFQFTAPNAVANDGKDSDADPESGLTNAFTVTLAGGDDLTIDAGIHTICHNVTNPGTIGYDQSICPGDVPAKLITLNPPSGGTGAFEYIWMKAEPGAPFEMIPGSTTPDYQPPALYNTTVYRKCVRRAGCYGYLEPPALTITVKDTCGGNFVNINASYITATQEVQIEWVTGSEAGDFKYQIQRSANGEDFYSLDLMQGHGIVGGINSYTYMDESPRNGTNYYRIVMTGPNGYEMTSDLVKVMAHKGEDSFTVFPNPAGQVFYVDIMKDQVRGGTVAVYDVNGKMVKSFRVEPGAAGPRKFLIPDLSSGVYFVKVTVDGEVKMLKLRKEN